MQMTTNYCVSLPSFIIIILRNRQLIKSL
jgi:hypothetical protein